ncbi:MAG: TlpA disulfide reductase family protein [Candidatus Omnitrophica bacterium]|nr:TlpA disulfide reductase family protein [Candidatus Omnitrophota bacterium]
MRNHKNILLSFLFLSLFFIWSIQAAGPALAEGDFAPDFKLQDLNKNEYTLSDYRDKHPVVLFFWATWCPFCRKELGKLKEIYPRLKQDGIELFAIAIGEADNKVKSFVKSYALNFKVLLDRRGSVASAYGIVGIPTYIFLNKKGSIAFRSNSFSQGEYKRLIAE